MTLFKLFLLALGAGLLVAAMALNVIVTWLVL